SRLFLRTSEFWILDSEFWILSAVRCPLMIFLTRQLSLIRPISTISPMMRSLLLACLLLFASQSGCIWKLWSKGKPIEERVFDLYGTVQSITQDQLVVQTKKKGELTFRMAPSSIKGSNFGPGAYVHVYYKTREDVKEVTMVVEKIN
ncbi:hypothetical protein MYX75_06355, partial [Acidobacteria bacterium AH-259-A15]|nr:hypothetical protein [Acidobacteria bacterium AH-259-A15]